jgi:hypothetical protein
MMTTETRQHNINPATGRCIMCGRNGWNRERHPECDYQRPLTQPAPELGGEWQQIGGQVWEGRRLIASTYNDELLAAEIASDHAAVARLVNTLTHVRNFVSDSRALRSIDATLDLVSRQRKPQ